MIKVAIIVAALVALAVAQCNQYCCNSGAGGICSTKATDTCLGVCVGTCSDKTSQCQCSEDCSLRNTPCTTWTCAANGQCVSTFSSAGTNCAPDACSTGTCDGAGTCNLTPITCAQPNECGDVRCDPVQGCVYSPDNNDCRSGLPCDTSLCVRQNVPAGPNQYQCRRVVSVAQCRASTGPCDFPEYCDGENFECPPEGGHDCDDGIDCTRNVCTNGVCSNPQDDGFCNSGKYNNNCVLNGVCRPTFPNALEDGCLFNVVAPTTQICRNKRANAPCDKDDYCDGVSPLCPETRLGPNDAPCRQGSGCDPAEYCDGVNDACPSDTGVIECDDGVACTIDSCTNGGCVFSPDPSVCSLSNPVYNKPCIASVACDGSNPAADANGCVVTYKSSTSQCGGGFDCFKPSFCTGSSGECPALQVQPSSHKCADADPLLGCSADSYCNGVSGTCPVAVRIAGDTCRNRAGPCDVPEQCDGISAECPPDTFESAGLKCREELGCRKEAVCTGTSASCPAPTYFEAGHVCLEANGECLEETVCDGVSIDCWPNYSPANKLCRPSAGICDKPEFCSGTIATCPANIYYDPGAVCREPAGPCDLPEKCTGSTAECPADRFVAAGDLKCRDSAGECDLDDWCNGRSAGCPDSKSTLECRAASGPCDVAEVCDGVNNDCPDDLVRDNTYTCNPGSGDVCDPDEKCDGVSKACPADVVRGAETTCRTGSGDLCDPDEVCTGVPDAPCPSNSYEPATTECRAGSGSPFGGEECNPAEHCPGVPGVPCPQDVCNDGTTCRPAPDQCDLPERCPTTAGCEGDVCPPNSFKPQGTPCDEGDNNTCTIGQCSGDANGCQAIVLPDGTPCDSACGPDATCLQAQCVCPCEVDCTWSKGHYSSRSPCEVKGKQKTDPAWKVEGVDLVEICGYSLCEIYTLQGGNDVISGSAQVLAENWGAVFLSLARQIDVQGFLCSGPQPAYVDQVYDNATAAIFEDPDFCSRQDYPLYNQWAEVLGNWSNGLFEEFGGPSYCGGDSTTSSTSGDSTSGGNGGGKGGGKGKNSRSVSYTEDPYGISGSFSAGYAVNPVGCVEAYPVVDATTASIVLCESRPSETVGSVLAALSAGSISRGDRRATLALLVAGAKATGGYLTPVYVQEVYTKWAATNDVCSGDVPSEFVDFASGAYCLLDGPCVCGSPELQQRIESTPRHVTSVEEMPHIKLQEKSKVASHSSSKLSAGAVVGIVLGAVFAVVIGVLIIGCLVFNVPAVQKVQKRFVGDEMNQELLVQSSMEE